MKISSSSAVMIVLIGAVFATSGYSQPLEDYEDCATQTSELQRLQGENADLQDHAKTLQTQFGECTSTVATLQTGNAVCDTQLKDVQTQIVALLNQQTAQQAETAAIQNQLSAVQEEKTDLLAQNAVLQNDISGLQSQLQASQAELAQVRLSVAGHNWVLGGRGQSCKTVCAARAGECNASLTSTINTESAIRTVYKLLTGAECREASVGTVFGNEPSIAPVSGDYDCIAASPGARQQQCDFGVSDEQNICCCGTHCPTSF